MITSSGSLITRFLMISRKVERTHRRILVPTVPLRCDDLGKLLLPWPAESYLWFLLWKKIGGIGTRPVYL